MPHLIDRDSYTTFGRQRAANAFPTKSYLRQDPHSIGQQILHVLAPPIEEAAAEVSRSLSNCFPLSADPHEIDVVYWIPYSDLAEEITGFIDKQAITVKAPRTNNIEEFWYQAIPTRLQAYDTGLVLLSHIEDLAYNRASLTSLPGGISHAISREELSPSTGTQRWTFVGGEATHYTSGGWGSGPWVDMTATDAVINMTAEFTSTRPCTGEPICVAFQLRSTDPFTLTAMAGYPTGGTSTQTFAIDEAWNQQYILYQPPTSTNTGIPFNRFVLPEDASLEVSDYHMLSYRKNATTSLPTSRLFPLLPSWAYLHISGGDNLFDCSEDIAEEARPTNIKITGWADKGCLSHEYYYPFYNGEHRCLNIYEDLEEAKIVRAPSGMSLSVSLSHFRSTSNIPDESQFYTTPEKQLPLFFSLDRNGGSSYLGYSTFEVEDIFGMVDGNDGISAIFYEELCGTNGTSPVDVVDIEVDPIRRHLWACSTNAIYLYYPEQRWATNLSVLKHRTYNPDVIIAPLSDNERWKKKGEQFAFEAFWRTKTKPIHRLRWSLKKPNGDLVDLDENSVEYAPSAAGEWWLSYDSSDENGRLHPRALRYDATQFGDYALHLISEFAEDGMLKWETDICVFGVHTKTPIATFANPISGTPIYGIDLDPYGHLRVASIRADSTCLVNVGRYDVRYDYYLADVEQSKFFLREPYDRVEVSIT